MPASTYDPVNDRFAGRSDRGPAIGATRAGVSALLRIEGAVVLVAAVVAYAGQGAGWVLFAALFLLPDVSMLGYLIGRRLGAALYNAGHTYLAPAALAALAWSQQLPELLGPALIWAAHIGFDRLMGYGLKYGTGFGDTHLGRRGRRP